MMSGADPRQFPPFYGKSVRFFIINIFLKIIELSKLKCGKWSGQMFSFFNFWALDAPSINRKPGKGNFREL